MSSIFVGSSNRRRSGSQNKALARAILIRQPPLYSFVGLRCISGVKPRPARMALALGMGISSHKYRDMQKRHEQGWERYGLSAKRIP
jgi:hypothetical protein